MGTAYGEQLRGKEAALRAALDAYPALAGVEAERIAGSPLPFGYRNQAKLVFRRRRVPATGGAEVLLGVYRPGTHSVLPAHRCAVHDPALRGLLAALREGVEALAIPIFDERRREGSLRYALARTSRDEKAIHLTLVSATAEVARLDRLLDGLRKAEQRLESAFLCVNPTPGNEILSTDIRRLFGPRALTERFGRLTLESRPDAFVQVNVDIATKIYAAAESWLAPGAEDVVLDVFGGVGGMGLALAPRVRRVLGVEAAAASVDCANGNARRAHLAQVEYVVGAAADLGAIAAERGIGRPAGEGALLAVVNPPRRGLTAAERAALASLEARKVLYLSCNPITLARDLADLAASGYRLARVRPFDMMPQTPHVEVLALLERGDSPTAVTTPSRDPLS